jgi:transposase-like protein
VSGRCGWWLKSVRRTRRSGLRCGAVAELLGIGTTEMVRKWVRQAEIDDGSRPGVSTEESAEQKRLKRESAKSKRANGIRKATRLSCGRTVRHEAPGYREVVSDRSVARGSASAACHRAPQRGDVNPALSFYWHLSR